MAMTKATMDSKSSELVETRVKAIPFQDADVYIGVFDILPNLQKYTPPIKVACWGTIIIIVVAIDYIVVVIIDVA